MPRGFGGHRRDRCCKNAAYLACEILSIRSPEVVKKLEDFRSKTRVSLEEKAKALKKRKP